MYKSTNMLRTRRRDNNVKPNRRLDRKSSRGMIYENEELRLKTININAEIERGQSDIKKLKRENEMLKKEIWCLRDEYEKLDKLLKDKEIDLSSASTTCSSSSDSGSGSSDSESCSSCSGRHDGDGDGAEGKNDEEDEDETGGSTWREVEATQNRENVQKTTQQQQQQQVRRLCDGLDQLSVVLEEPASASASPPSSRRASSAAPLVLRADQSYPACDSPRRAATLPMQSVSGNFFSPIKPSRSYDDDPRHFEQLELPLYAEQLYQPTAAAAGGGDYPFRSHHQQNGAAPTSPPPPPPPLHDSYQPYVNGHSVSAQEQGRYYGNVATPHQLNDGNSAHGTGVGGGAATEYYTTEKRVDTAATTFYQNMVLVPKHHQNGGGVKLQGMAKTSGDLLVKLDGRDFHPSPTPPAPGPPRSTFSNGGNLEDLLNDIETISRDILHMSTAQNAPGPFDQLHDGNAAVNDGNVDFLARIEQQDTDVTYLQNPELVDLERDQGQYRPPQSAGERPYKSELNVTLMPSPMALLDNGASRYRCADAAHSRSLDDLNSSTPQPSNSGGRTCSLVDPALPLHDEERLQQQMGGGPGCLPAVTPQYSSPVAVRRRGATPATPAPAAATAAAEANPFFFGKLTDEYFNQRYNPDNYLRVDGPDRPRPSPTPSPQPPRRRPAPAGSPRPPDAAAPATTAPAAVENVEDLRFRTGAKPDPARTTDSSTTPAEGQEAQAGNSDASAAAATAAEKPKGLSIRRKVSIHFKGRARDKEKEKAAGGRKTSGNVEGAGGGGEKKQSLFDVKFSSSSEGGGKGGKVNSSAESSAAEPKTPSGSDSAPHKSRGRRSASGSPDRPHQPHQQPQQQKSEKRCHKKHKKASVTGRARRGTAVSVERLPLHRERSYSVCTDRSNVLGVGFGGLGQYGYDSDRDESLSSCDTGSKTRKMSSLSNIPLTGKVPWCGCWGNGCL